MVLGLVGGGHGDRVALHGFGAQVEAALGQVEVLLEDDHHGADERIMLALGVLREVVRQLVGEHFTAPLFDAIEVGRAELETVFVRGYRAVAADRHGFGVDLALQGAGKVDRLQVFGAELGKDSVDRAFYTFLKTVENAHGDPFLYPYPSYTSVGKSIVISEEKACLSAKFPLLTRRCGA